MSILKTNLKNIVGDIGNFQSSIQNSNTQNGGADKNPPISSGTQSQVEALQGEGFTKKIENGKIVMTRPIKEGGGQKQVDVQAPKAISGGTPGSAWDNKMKSLLAGGTSYEELAKKGHGTVEGLKKRFPDAYKPKMEGQPEKVTGEEKLVIGAVESDANQSNENDGSSAADTKPDTVDDTPAPDGKRGNMSNVIGGGSGPYTQDFTPSVASKNPSVTPQGSGKDIHHELSLVNMQTSRA